MKRFLVILALFLSAAVVLTGCGGGGGSSSTTTSTSGGSTDGGTSDGGTTSAYAGTSKISGTITVSGSDAAAVTQASSQAARLGGLRAAATSRASALTENAIVKLMVVGENGDLEDTGIECTLTEDADGNPSYSCDGVKDGVNYIVRYVKLLGDGRAVDMKAPVEVPEGASEVADTQVNAKTSVVVEALVDAILEATAGSTIDDETVGKIIDAVADTIETLVDSGVIQVPSMIVQTDTEDLEALVTSETSNDDLDNASGALLSEEDVAAGIGMAKTEVSATKFDLSSLTTDEEKRTFIRTVFEELLDDDGIPDFFIQFFGDKFVEGYTGTVGDLVQATAAGVQLSPEAQTAGITVTTSDIITAFKQEIIDINDLLDKKDAYDACVAAGTGSCTPLTTAEKAALADVPPVIPGLFPRSEASTWENVTSSTTMNVPQGIALVIFTTDGYLPELFEQANLAGGTASQAEGGGVQYEQKEYVDFDPFQPNSLMDLMGFQTWAQANGDSLGVDITHLSLFPSKMWLDDGQGGGQEYDSLNAYTCFLNFADMLAMMSGQGGGTSPDYSNAVVTLSYPKADGTTGTATMSADNKGGGDMNESCWMIDPWMASGCDTWDWSNGPCPYFQQITPADLISDFVTGTYTVTVDTDGDGTADASKSFTKKVITGMQDASPTIIAPAATPEWPGIDATQAEIDAFNTAMSNYQPTNFPANVVCDTWDSVDTNACLAWHEPASGESADAAEITFQWEAPDVDLPDGVKIRYNLNVGLDNGCDQNGCNWQNIWNSWEGNRNIYATSFKLPVAVKQTPQGSQAQYNLNLDVEFVDFSTGEVLGQGGHAWAQFLVAQPLDTTATFTITGQVKVYDTSQGWPGTEMTSIPSSLNLKAGVVKEVCDWNIVVGDPCTRTIISGTVAAVGTDGSFTLTPTLGDFLDNATNGAWLDVRIWDDTDDDGVLDQESGGLWENEGWQDWESLSQTQINVWGGRIEVNTQTCSEATRQLCDENWSWQYENQVITGGETVDFVQGFRFDYWDQTGATP